jgi:hypothetical protein
VVQEAEEEGSSEAQMMSICADIYKEGIGNTKKKLGARVLISHHNGFRGGHGADCDISRLVVFKS